MSKKIFTEKERSLLSKNPYVKSISSKGITYTNEFKRHFIAENENGKLPRMIFEECGFDTEIVGIERIKSASKRWRAAYQACGIDGLEDTRKGNSGRPREGELSLEEKNAQLQAQINLLKAENELLKKLNFRRKEAKGEEITISAEQKFLLIRTIIEKYKLKNKVRYLCEVSGISRSGFYNYFHPTSEKRRKKREEKDKQLRNIVMKAYKFRSRKKGARQIKMTLAGQFKVVFNLKRIRRIMKKYGIICPIRKANPYRRMMKATKEHRVLPNLLQRNFKQDTPGKVLLIDITYLFYGKGKKAYLSTVKDGSTNELLAYHISERMTLDIATDTLLKLKNNRRVKLAPNAFIHSDQGVHYTSPIFQKIIKGMGLLQSMSRRGNCWDNAPQESFFGHFKDETSIKPCETLDELKKEIKSYMTYYNHFRYQWNMKKMTPVQYRDHLLKTA
ncbi:IS3 family transposase [Alkalihalobacterium sp. APHAB7]|uniref:IS3 family transposase n=1 Tax=Alkalihalobacterium sp. APHAB7 TaxID=3402081 RepID=UPI003AACACC6